MWGDRTRSVGIPREKPETSHLKLVTSNLIPIIAHVDMNTFFVSVERLKDPTLEGRPVVVGGQPGQRSVVTSASYEARRYGIHSAMPMNEAVRCCPDLIIVSPSFRDYQHYHDRIKSILADFTPALEMTSIDEGYLDLTGTETLWGPPVEAGPSIRRRILDETGLPASIGISSNKLVSKVASDLAKPGPERSEGLALSGGEGPRLGRRTSTNSAGRPASRRQHPFITSEGVLVVPPGEEAAFLAPLPLSRLPGCGKVTLPKLQAMGLETIGGLAVRTEEELAAVFGEVGRSLWQRANGRGSQILETEHQRKSISKETTFRQDVRDQARLRSVLHQLTEEVGASLRRRRVTARTVTLKLRYENFETHTHSRTLPAATDRTDTVFEVATWLLDTHRARQRAVRLIGVGVSNLMKGPVQEDLFNTEGRIAARRSTLPPPAKRPGRWRFRPPFRASS